MKELSNTQKELLKERTNIDGTFVKRFKKLIEDKKNEYELNGEKITDGSIAKEIGITPQSMVAYTYNKAPELVQLIKISKYFNVSLEYLTGVSNNKYFVDYSLGKEFGLNDAAVSNLKRIHNYATEWGYSEKDPNLVLFAINSFLGSDLKLLYLIGDYLSLPSINNQHLEDTTKKYIEDKKLYLPDLELYNYKIFKSLEKMANDIRETEEVAIMLNAKANKIENKELEQQQKDFEEYYNEQEKRAIDEALKISNYNYE